MPIATRFDIAPESLENAVFAVASVGESHASVRGADNQWHTDPNQPRLSAEGTPMGIATVYYRDGDKFGTERQFTVTITDLTQMGFETGRYDDPKMVELVKPRIEVSGNGGRNNMFTLVCETMKEKKGAKPAPAPAQK